MSNTPTESEFDKAILLIEHEWMLEGRSEEQIHAVRNFLSAKLPAIKQAVDEHVIGEDDKNYPFAESEIVNIEGYNTLMGGRNLLRREQHVALYGGDKK